MSLHCILAAQGNGGAGDIPQTSWTCSRVLGRAGSCCRAQGSWDVLATGPNCPDPGSLPSPALRNTTGSGRNPSLRKLGCQRGGLGGVLLLFNGERRKTKVPLGRHHFIYCLCPPWCRAAAARDVSGSVTASRRFSREGWRCLCCCLMCHTWKLRCTIATYLLALSLLQGVVFSPPYKVVLRKTIKFKAKGRSELFL